MVTKDWRRALRSNGVASHCLLTLKKEDELAGKEGALRERSVRRLRSEKTDELVLDITKKTYTQLRYRKNKLQAWVRTLSQSTRKVERIVDGATPLQRTRTARGANRANSFRVRSCPASIDRVRRLPKKMRLNAQRV